MTEPQPLGRLLPDLVADLARRHGHIPPTTLTDRTPTMPLAPDHGPYTDDLDAMTLDDLLRVQRLLQEEALLMHFGPDTLRSAVEREIQHRDQLRHEATGGAA